MERIEKLKEMLVEMPDDSFLKHALALEMVKIGHDEAAKGLFESILDKDPQYVGTYYHLARLLERLQKNNEAILVYEKGMEACKKANDKHALNELRMAYDDLTT